jgi:TctA family transporter
MLDVITAVMAIAAGAMAGLLPGLPAWVLPLLIAPWAAQLGPDHVVMFWIISVIASQFFGSMASVMFGIPGENSSMVYVRDLHAFTTDQRRQLLMHTANSGLVATLVALVVTALGHQTMISVMPLLATTTAALIVMLSVSILVIAGSGSVVVGAASFVVGAVLTTKSNIALPALFQQVNAWTYDLSIISLTVALLVLPRLWARSEPVTQAGDGAAVTRPIASTVSGTTWGLLTGFLPGATATIASALAYRRTAGTVWDRVISAEAANNSTIVIGAFLLIYLQIALSLDSVMVTSVFAQQGWTIYHDLARNFDLTKFMIVVVPATICTWWLARTASPIFALLAQHVNRGWITVAVAGVMLTIDWIIAPGTYHWAGYTVWFMAFVGVGVLWQRQAWSPLPLIFGFVLGDGLVWAIWQTFL